MSTDAMGAAMSCHDDYHTNYTEEAVLNESILPGWRRFRIEYGFECACPEGIIYIKDCPEIYEKMDKIIELLGNPIIYKAACT